MNFETFASNIIITWLLELYVEQSGEIHFLTVILN